MARILIVENERIAAQDLTEILQELGHEVLAHATNFDDARAACEEHQPELALLDIHIDGQRDGISLAAELREEFTLAIAFITSRADHQTIEQASATCPNGYLVKPFSQGTVDALVSTAIANFASAHGTIDAKVLSDTRSDNKKRLSENDQNAVTKFIDQNLDKPIRIEELAEIVDLPSHTFAKRFQASLGASPYQFLINMRVEEAKRLLRNTEWRLAEIALSVGFSSQAHFTSSFKKAVGVTPSAYRNATS